MEIKLIPVEPIGKRSSMAHHNYGDKRPGEWKMAEFDVYPESPNGVYLREELVKSKWYMKDAAPHLGMSVVDLSSLRMGRLTTDEQGWNHIFDALGLQRQTAHSGANE